MSEDNSTFTVGFKAGPNYKEALVAVRGDTIEEFESNIMALQESTLQVIAETQALFLAAAALQSGETGAVASVTPIAQGRTCPHGARTRREGDNSRGHWIGWYCPLPKGTPGQCKTEFE